MTFLEMKSWSRFLRRREEGIFYEQMSTCLNHKVVNMEHIHWAKPRLDAKVPELIVESFEDEAEYYCLVLKRQGSKQRWCSFWQKVWARAKVCDKAFTFAVWLLTSVCFPHVCCLAVCSGKSGNPWPSWSFQPKVLRNSFWEFAVFFKNYFICVIWSAEWSPGTELFITCAASTTAHFALVKISVNGQ